MIPVSYLAYQLSKSGRIGPNTVTVKRGDEILDGPYPKDFTGFVGQDLAITQLLIAATSATRRGAVMDHVLLASGYPGVGKTTLARLLAHQLGVGYLELGDKVTTKDAVNALKCMADKDILALDEIHRLVAGGKSSAEWLLTLLQDGTLQTAQGVIQAPKITIVATTTDAQKLPETILDRFVVKPVLLPYTNEQAAQVARVTADRLGFGKEFSGETVPMPEGQGWLVAVAKACNNNPRKIRQLLIQVRDIALATELSNYSVSEGYDLTSALEFAGLSEDGLDRLQQEYLAILYAHGGRLGLNTIKATLNESDLGHTEKALIQRGFITITGTGRTLTEYGTERAQQVAEEYAASA